MDKCKPLDGGARRDVFEALVEASCHEGKVDAALEVFDDFKAGAYTRPLLSST